jgi:hypothetical protein
MILKKVTIFYEHRNEGLCYGKQAMSVRQVFQYINRH